MGWGRVEWGGEGCEGVRWGRVRCGGDERIEHKRERTREPGL